MKKSSILIVIALVAGLLFAACEKDEIAKPVINILELGQGDTHGNDHTATIGGDLHIEVEIVAEGTIDIVQVMIHPEGNHGKGDEWELDTIYTKFQGLKNTEFHEHLEIDSTAEAGDYHFDFIVTDVNGYQTSAEAELVLVK